MALKLYFDAELNNPVQIDGELEGEPDETKQAVEEGNNVEEVVSLFLASDDTTLTYESIVLSQHDTNGEGVVIEYREATDTTWEDPLTLADGDYGTALEIERRVFKENLTAAIYVDTNYHRLQYEEFAKA